MYLHVLEHISDDIHELKSAMDKLNNNGYFNNGACASKYL